MFVGQNPEKPSKMQVLLLDDDPAYTLAAEHVQIELGQDSIFITCFPMRAERLT